jgi:hypothetical protein
MVIDYTLSVVCTDLRQNMSLNGETDLLLTAVESEAFRVV